MKRLCFGSFAKILWLCAADGVSKYDLIKSLIHSVDNKCLMTAQAATGLLNCEKGLPNGKGQNSLGDVVSKAREVDLNLVSEYFKEKIVPLISLNRRKIIICALCTLITEDETILDDTVVEIVTGTRKKDISKQGKYVLSDFLAGIFLYTVTIDNRAGTFLEIIYPCIKYTKGDVCDYPSNPPASFLYSFIMEVIKPKFKLTCDDLPDDKHYCIKEYARIREDEYSCVLVDIKDIAEEYPWFQGEPEIVGMEYKIEARHLFKRSHEDILAVLNDDNFIFKSEYLAALRYLDMLKERQTTADELLLASL